jgi:tRNA(fMet)-specific endonuclease VapC
LKQKGQLIEAEDLFIGATALHNQLKLATGNLRHFERIVGLEFVPVQSIPS